MSSDRPVTSVLQDIVFNLQEIVRSEVRLVKQELREEAGNLKSAAFLVVFGTLATSCALMFVLLAALYLLSMVMPKWGAALVVAGAAAAIGGITLSTGLRRYRESHPLRRTKETLKENAEWIAQQTK